MEPILKLNPRHFQRLLWRLLLAAFIAIPVGLLQQRLMAIYVQPTSGSVNTVSAATMHREDGVLFGRASAAGLLRLQKDGRIVIAPIDLPLRQLFARLHPELLIPEQNEFDWFDRTWDSQVKQLHRALYFSAAGRYVRQEIENFNASQRLAAVRSRIVSNPKGEWSADWDGIPLPLTDGILPTFDRVFLEQLGGDWESWRWVARWPAFETDEPIHLQWRLTAPAVGSESLELLLIGRLIHIVGAQLMTSAVQCLQSTPCLEEKRVAHRLTLKLDTGVSRLELWFLPLSAALGVHPFWHGIGPIQHEAGRLIWRDGTGPGASTIAGPTLSAPLSVSAAVE